MAAGSKPSSPVAAMVTATVLALACSGTDSTQSSLSDTDAGQQPDAAGLDSVDSTGGTGGAGGADAGGGGGSGGGFGGGGGSKIGDCSVYWSEGPGAEIEMLVCTQADGGGFSCQCGEEAHYDVVAESCDDALEQVCGVHPNDPQWCQEGEHACWPVPDQPEAWTCLCEGASDAVPATGVWCQDAAHSACAEPCSSWLGTCEPLAEHDMYSCSCSYYGGPARVWKDYTCEGALSYACYPFIGCNDPAGYCDLDGDGLVCRCLDGTVGSVGADESGVLDCEAAIEQVCGHVPIDEDMECEGSNADVDGSCHVMLDQAGSYACTCDRKHSPGGWTHETTADSCEEALEVLCFSSYH